MKDGEIFDEFYGQLNDITNSCFNLGENIADNKIIRKILRSIPKRFRLKVIVIEEIKDVDVVRVK